MQQDERNKRRAISKYERFEDKLANCFFCLESQRAQKSLLVSIGLKMYLRLPSVGRLVTGQCMIVPVDHALASVSLEENAYEELEYFKKHLVKMYAAEEPPRAPVFCEMIHSLKSQRHTVIHCYPLGMEEFDASRLFFKKAILEADSMFAVNKHLIDTKARPFRSSVPKDFPYFAVSFGMEGGYAHVIEDESLVSKDFGLEVMAGMIDEPFQFILRQKPERPDQEAARVKAFAAQWSRFDWTLKLA